MSNTLIMHRPKRLPGNNGYFVLGLTCLTQLCTGFPMRLEMEIVYMHGTVRMLKFSRCLSARVRPQYEAKR